MRQSKLITLFRSFNKEELKAFESFLLSPFFNQSEKLVKLFRLIEPHQPLFDSNKLEKEKLYKALHGKVEYKDPTMRELISEMFKLAKMFLAHNGLRKDNLQTSAIRHDWLFAHNIEKLTDAEQQNRRLLLDERTEHDTCYYHHRWLYDLNQFEIISERMRGVEHKLLTDFDILQHVHSLNRAYLVNSFIVQTYLLAMARIYKFSLNEALLQQVETLALLYVNKGDGVIDILFNIFQLVRTYEEKYFFELKARFLENNKSVPAAVMGEAGATMENFCTDKLRWGEEQFRHDIMEIYRFEVENNFFLHNGTMSYIYYFNVAIRGSEPGELDWTEYFVESHKKYLPEEFREEAYKFAKAHILFARKKYLEALRLALMCNIPFLMSKILIRNLIARTQYELDMWDELQTELNAHQHHLKNERFTEDRRQHLQTFITVMRQLAELKGSRNPRKLILLSKKVEAQKGFANRRWFREKIKELEDANAFRKKTFT